jgi:hypothetical protein
MYGDNRRHATPALPVNQSAIVPDQTFRLKVLAEFLRVHIVRMFIDVHEDRKGSGLGYGFRGSNERIRDCDYAVAWLDSGRNQGEPQRIGATTYPDAVWGITVLSEVPLKVLDHWATDEPPALKGGLKNGT